MNDDFFHFFDLIKDDNEYIEALNTVKYRYGLYPQQYQNLYSQFLENSNDSSESLNIDMIVNTNELTQQQKAVVTSLVEIIIDSRLTILDKTSTDIEDFYEIKEDLLFLLIKLMFQVISAEIPQYTVRSAKVQNKVSIPIDSKTNTQIFKKSFLHHIFSSTEKTAKNASLPILTLLAPVHFSSLKHINISPYKNLYDCYDIRNDARFMALSSNSLDEIAPLMKLLQDSYSNRESSAQNTVDVSTKPYSIANFNTFYLYFSDVFSAVCNIWETLEDQNSCTLLEGNNINAMRVINNYIAERIYHFNFYQKLCRFLDDNISEYELKYNQLLSISMLENVFYVDRIFHCVRQKENITALYHTAAHNEEISPQATTYDSSLMACRESVDLLSMIYYPIIFTLAYSIVKDRISFDELADLFNMLSIDPTYKKMLDSIDIANSKTQILINPSNINKAQISKIMSESFYIVNRRYYRNESPFTDYYLKTFCGCNSPLRYPSHLIPAILPSPPRMNSDEYENLLAAEEKDREYAKPQQSQQT
ncbi:MAG: hypothetical protein J6A19_06555 [Oscillospiraceae bacterium]|nr:hypothetical protein [Oscillospiraceae bacterium]